MTGIGRRQMLRAAGAAALTPALPSGVAVAAGEARPGRTPAPSTAGVSQRIAEHITHARWADIGKDAQTMAKWRLLDVIGCALAGQRGENIAALLALVELDGGLAEATLLGTGRRIPARDAAMANAIMARAFDHEVMTVVVEDREVASHHAPTTVMTALALAERHKANGQAFLTALILGDDLAARTLAGAGIDFNDGWDGVPLHATLGATAIAARLMELDSATTLRAMGLAVDQIGGTVQSIWDGGNAWKIQQGTPARNGIFAAELAAAGWSGMAEPLLAPFGLYDQFTPGCSRPDLLTARLGQAFWGEAYFKPYPSCAANHPTIECALTLREQSSIAPADIAKIRLEVQPHILKLFVAKPFLTGPSAHSQANFNLRFACANALLRGGFAPADYEPTALADPQLTRLIAATQLTTSPHPGVTVTATLRDGTQHSATLPGQPRHYPKMGGSSQAEIVAKFERQCAFHGGIAPALVAQIRDRCLSIERETDMSHFARTVATAMAARPRLQTRG